MIVIERLIYICLGLFGGWLLGGALTTIWFVINSLLLGYGDHGPEWLNIVNRWIQGVSILAGLLFSQWLYAYRRKRKSKES